MTEKQKMLMGILYNAEDQALIEERNHAKSLTRQFNEHWEDKGRRNYLIGQIFGRMFIWKHPFIWIMDIGQRLEVTFSQTLICRF